MKTWKQFVCAGFKSISSRSASSGDTGEEPRQLSAKDQLGRDGERLATDFLTSQGYKIIAHNYRLVGGEADIIALDQKEVVFIEVKTRRSERYGLPEDAINLRKRRTLIRLATFFMRQRRYSQHSWRIDVIAIVWPEREPPQIRHHLRAIESEFG